MSAKLRIVHSTSNGDQVYELTHNLVRLGRGVDSDVVIASSGVSRQHARVTLENGRMFIEDLGSSNGTYIDDQRLSPSVKSEVVPNSKIRLGTCEGIWSISLQQDIAEISPMGDSTQMFKNKAEAKIQEILLKNGNRNSEHESENPIQLSKDEAKDQLHKIEYEKIIEAAQNEAIRIREIAQNEAEKLKSRSAVYAETLTRQADQQVQKNLEQAKQQALMILGKAEADSKALKMRIDSQVKESLLQAETSKNTLISEAKLQAQTEYSNQVLELRLKIESLDRTKASIETEIQSLQSKQQVALSAYEDSNKKSEKAKSESNRLQQELSQTEKSLKEVTSQKEQELNQLDEKVKAAQNQLANFAFKFNEVKTQHAQFSSENVSLKTDSEQTKKDLESLRIEAETQKKKLEEAHIARKLEIEQKEEKLIQESKNYFQTHKKEHSALIAKNIKEFIVLKLKSSNSEFSPENNLLLESIDQIVKDVMISNRRPENEQIKELMGKSKFVFKSRRMLSGKHAVIGIPLVLGLIGAFNSESLNYFLKTAFEPKHEAISISTAGTEHKFIPVQDQNFRTTYTENVLYTKDYVNWKLDDKERQVFTLEVKTLLEDHMKLNESTVINLIARETSLIRTLKTISESIHPKFLDLGLKKMNAAEQVDVEYLKSLLMNSENYTAYRQFEERRFVEYWTKKKLIPLHK
jgi:pSer/pThr/pTyr-binding forkhead associated (FHA) protein